MSVPAGAATLLKRAADVFTATFKGFDRFPEVNADIDALCIAALTDAADAAAAVAAASATIDLDLEVDHASPDVLVEGFSSGIRSRKTGKRNTRIALFFDEGTLGQHRGKLKGGRRSSWNVSRASGSYQAHRHDIKPVEGIRAQRFFPKARAAGRKALLARIDRGV